MSIAEGIDARLTEAMRARDAATTSTLRLIKSALKNAYIAQQKELDETQVIGVLQKEVKLRQDAARSYDEASRPELASKEREEIRVIKEFLPEGPSEEAVKKAVEEAIQQIGATSMAQMGPVIGSAKSALGPGADSAIVAAEAKRQLTSG
jgi:uncharacterized protein